MLLRRLPQGFGFGAAEQLVHRRLTLLVRRNAFSMTFNDRVVVRLQRTLTGLSARLQALTMLLRWALLKVLLESLIAGRDG